jgi:hypothetical protein
MLFQGHVLVPRLQLIEQNLLVESQHALLIFEMPSLQRVVGNVSIRYNSKLERLQLPLLQEVGESFVVWMNNPAATASLTRLGQVAQDLQIDTFSVDLPSLASVTGSLIVARTAEIRLPFLQWVGEDLLFTQLDLNDFGIVMPELAQVGGDIAVKAARLFLDLVHFPKLEEVHASMRIYDAKQIRADKLKTIGGDLVLSYAPKGSLVYFQLLEVVTGLLLIDSSDLDTQQVFGSLAEVRGGLRLSRLAHLPEIRFPDLRVLGDLGFEIFECRRDFVVDLPALETSAGIFRVSFTPSPRFNVPALRKVKTSIEILFCDSLTGLSIPRIEEAGSLMLQFNSDLEDLSGLQSLRKLSGAVNIVGNRVSTSNFSKLAGLDIVQSQVKERFWNCVLIEAMGLPTNANPKVECLAEFFTAPVTPRLHGGRNAT